MLPIRMNTKLKSDGSALQRGCDREESMVVEKVFLRLAKLHGAEGNKWLECEQWGGHR